MRSRNKRNDQLGGAAAMVQPLTTQIIVFIAFANIAMGFIDEVENRTSVGVKHHASSPQARRLFNKKRVSTSSSGEHKQISSKISPESLDMSMSEAASDLFKPKTGFIPKSSLERTGWRKWHRKCNKCLEDMVKKWRDPSISWVCGAYQRARRTFKSQCMMAYRNCQDGTMFVEIYPGRCRNDTPGDPRPHGDHFFYEYKVVLSAESDKSSETASETEEEDIVSY